MMRKTLLFHLKVFVGKIAWYVFLWANCMSPKEYWASILRQELDVFVFDMDDGIVDEVTDRVGMSPGGWDFIDPIEIIRAVLGIVYDRARRTE